MRKTIALCAVAALVASAACNKDGAVATTTTTGAGIITNEDAVQRLTAQRCQREMDCNKIGQGKSYEDYAACERETSQDLRSTLRSDECPSGLHEDKLNECMRDVRYQKCGDPFDAVGRLSTCRSGRLCRQ